jgi:hypothetical protein
MIRFDSQGGEAQGVSSDNVENAAGVAKSAPKCLSSNPMIKVYRTKSPASPWDGRVAKPIHLVGCGPL